MSEELEEAGISAPEVRTIFKAEQSRAERRFGGLTLTRAPMLMPETMPWGFSISLIEGEDEQMSAEHSLMLRSTIRSEFTGSWIAYIALSRWPHISLI